MFPNNENTVSKDEITQYCPAPVAHIVSIIKDDFFMYKPFGMQTDNSSSQELLLTCIIFSRFPKN